MTDYASQQSYVGIFPEKESYFQQQTISGTVDSTSTLGPRIQTSVQRAGESIVDIAGQIFDSSASPVTFTKVEYSVIGPNGPWSDPDILTSDSAFLFPTQGDEDGEPFNIPIEITQDPGVSTLWYRIEVSF